MPISEGSNLGPFRITGALGRGGMASVYRAFEPGLDRTIAVKVLPAEYLHDPNFAERFRREAQVIAKLEHPHIVPIYAYGIDQGMPWMSMRLVAGGSLYSLLHEGERLARARTLQLLAGVASALDYAHAAGVVHRDVKPQNILIDEHQHVYLADFGIAKMVEGAPGLTQTGMITGTPQYMAPEQAMGSKVDHRADIYSLGVVAYECFTGRVPFTADTPLAVLMKHVRDPIPLPSVAEVPEHQCNVLLKALAKAPADRWPTAKAFVEAMQHAETTATMGVAPTLVAATIKSPPVAATARARPPAAPSPRRSPATRWIVAGIAAAALFVLAAGGGLLWWMGREAPVVTPTEAPAPPQPAAESPSAAEAQPEVAASTAPTPMPVAEPEAPAPAPVATPRARGIAPTPRPGVSVRPSPALAARTEAATPAPAEPPAAEPAPPPSAPAPIPERPSGLAFALGSPIALGDPRQALITLQTVTFKFNPKNSELQAEVAGYCADGKDHAVDLQLALFDQGGATVATLKGRGSIEENDKGKIRAKQLLTQSVVSSISSFRLTFQARPD